MKNLKTVSIVRATHKKKFNTVMVRLAALKKFKTVRRVNKVVLKTVMIKEDVVNMIALKRKSTTTVRKTVNKTTLKKNMKIVKSAAN